MKVCILQPLYSVEYDKSDALFGAQLEMLEQCDDSMDLIVLPESCDVPCLAPTKDDFEASVRKYNEPLMEAVRKTARRCNATVFFNAVSSHPGGLRNTTWAARPDGSLLEVYYKQHLTPGEISKRKLDAGYNFEPTEPTILELDGIRYGFMVCYDAYFYEGFAALARYEPDVIIACSHQRSDRQDVLEFMHQFMAYHCNAWVLRSSVSMGHNCPTGGASMVVAPDGKVLTNMGSRVGMEILEIDPHEKYFKPAGFGNPESAHWQYIEKGRRPWKYRVGGPAIVPYDEYMGYPRVCAHRGFNTVAPENSLPAFGAAVALGAEEIEFDLWYTADGEIVSLHDSTLDRVSDGTGKVYDHTYEGLLKLDFGGKRGEGFKGLRIITFEEILKKFAGHTIMNIHVKTVDNDVEYDEALLRKMVALIDKYDCRRHVYFMCGNDHFMELAQRVCPDICRCMGAGTKKWEIVDRAIRYDCKKVQLFKPYFNQEMIDKAHAHGITCNVFWSDDPQETREFLDMGIDCILTNDYHRISQVVAQWKAEHDE